jgi:hypothetical protein
MSKKQQSHLPSRSAVTPADWQVEGNFGMQEAPDPQPATEFIATSRMAMLHGHATTARIMEVVRQLRP